MRIAERETKEERLERLHLQKGYLLREPGETEEERENIIKKTSRERRVSLFPSHQAAKFLLLAHFPHCKTPLIGQPHQDIANPALASPPQKYGQTQV